jgi:hypothetical protein
METIVRRCARSIRRCNVKWLTLDSAPFLDVYRRE